MAIGIQYGPVAAIGGAARTIGVADFMRQEMLDEERRRQQAMDLALKMEQLRGTREQGAFDRDMALANFQEGQRRFDTGLAFDDYKQQQAFVNQQANLGAQLQGRQAADAADIAQQQFRAASDQALQRDRLGAGLAEQQMQMQADAARQQAISQRQMEQAALTGDYQLRNKLLTGEVPEWVQSGLREGSLKYTDRQKQEMADLQDSIDKARQDRSLSPDELMRFEAQQMGRYNQVRDNPTEVPFDERPLSMEQMFEQETMPYTDPLTGKEGRMQREVRNGMARWVPVDSPKDESADIARKEQEFQLKQQQAEVQQEQKNRQYDMDLRKQFNEFHIEALRKEFEVEMDALTNEMPTIDDKQKEGPADANGKPTLVPDVEAYNQSMDAWRAKKDALVRRFNDRRTTLPLAPPSLSSPIQAQVPAIPGQNQPADVAPPTPDVVVDEAGVERVVVESEEHAKMLGLPDDTRVIINGRPAIWKN